MRPVQPSVVATRRHVMLSAMPSSGRVYSVIKITGIGDHDRPEWLIRINGMRRLAVLVPLPLAPADRPNCERRYNRHTARLKTDRVTFCPALTSVGFVADSRAI